MLTSVLCPRPSWHSTLTIVANCKETSWYTSNLRHRLFPRALLLRTLDLTASAVVPLLRKRLCIDTAGLSVLACCSVRLPFELQLGAARAQGLDLNLNLDGESKLWRWQAQAACGWRQRNRSAAAVEDKQWQRSALARVQAPRVPCAATLECLPERPTCELQTDPLDP